jgi:hypothetical protein
VKLEKIFMFSLLYLINLKLFANFNTNISRQNRGFGVLGFGGFGGFGVLGFRGLGVRV